MIVKAVKYFIKNNMETIRNDWREYCSLRKSCNNLSQKLDDARCNISRHLVQEKADKDSVLGCIKVDFVWNEFSGEDRNASWTPMEHYCNYFDESDRNNRRVCCYRACPYYQRNNTYMKILGDYRAAIANKRNFWTEKFANVK